MRTEFGPLDIVAAKCVLGLIPGEALPHPWIRISLVVRAILTTPWPPGVWRAMKDGVSPAFVLRARLAKARSGTNAPSPGIGRRLQRRSVSRRQPVEKIHGALSVRSRGEDRPPVLSEDLKPVRQAEAWSSRGSGEKGRAEFNPPAVF